MTDDNLKRNIPTRTTGKVWDILKPRARTMRKDPTPAEALLWSRLRRKQIENLRFRRQAPIGHFIVDFYCPQVKLVIEVDGAIHNDSDVQARDIERQAYLESLGLTVVRFTNQQVISELDIVIEQVREFVLSSSA